MAEHVLGSFRSNGHHIVMITTRDDFAQALERLRRRDPAALAAFIVSLAQDSGPIGEQVRTFIVGDDQPETVASVRKRIKGLEVPSEYEHRHARGKEIGNQLGFIVESIESLVLPVNPKVAFELLVAVFEADGKAMENCLDHHWEVECAFERAAGVMVEAAKAVPRAEVEEKIKALMAVDSYGVRGSLKLVLASVGES
jgi:hypothetical protein